MLASGSGRKARHAIGVMFRRFVKIDCFFGRGGGGRNAVLKGAYADRMQVSRKRL